MESVRLSFETLRLCFREMRKEGDGVAVHLRRIWTTILAGAIDGGCDLGCLAVGLGVLAGKSRGGTTTDPEDGMVRMLRGCDVLDDYAAAVGDAASKVAAAERRLQRGRRIDDDNDGGVETFLRTCVDPLHDENGSSIHRRVVPWVTRRVVRRWIEGACPTSDNDDDGNHDALLRVLLSVSLSSLLDEEDDGECDETGRDAS